MPVPHNEDKKLMLLHRDIEGYIDFTIEGLLVTAIT